MDRRKLGKVLYLKKTFYENTLKNNHPNNARFYAKFPLNSSTDNPSCNTPKFIQMNELRSKTV